MTNRQQALALKKIYDWPSRESRPVFAVHCKFPAGLVDGIPWPAEVAGHSWLRVRIGDEEFDL